MVPSCSVCTALALTRLYVINRKASQFYLCWCLVEVNLLKAGVLKITNWIPVQYISGGGRGRGFQYPKYEILILQANSNWIKEERKFASQIFFFIFTTLFCDLCVSFLQSVIKYMNRVKTWNRFLKVNKEKSACLQFTSHCPFWTFLEILLISKDAEEGEREYFNFHP